MRQRQIHQLKKCSSRRTFPALLAALLILVTGCSGSQNTTGSSTGQGKAAQQPVSSKPTATGVAAAGEQPAAVYSYDPGDRRDPFTPIVSREEEQISKLGDRPPLERYSISEFKLTGIVWGGYGYNAMLEGPNGKGYFVKVGTLIGPQRSKVIKITQDSLVIEERFKNYMGVEERKERIVNLRKRQEGTQ